MDARYYFLYEGGSRMKQTQVTLVLGLVLVLIFGGMLWGQYSYFYKNKPTFPEQIEEVVLLAREKEWEEADVKLKVVEQKWEKAYPLIAIKYADQEYTFLNMGFKGLRAAIDHKDEKLASKEGEICVMLFKNITAISSKP